MVYLEEAFPMRRPETFFERLAMDRNMTVEEVREMISKRIEEG